MVNTRSQASTPTCLHSGGNSEGPSGLRGSHSAVEACSSASHSPAAPSALSRCPFSGARPAKPPACGPSPGTCVPGNHLRMLARPHHPTNHHASLARGPFTARLVARAASPRCPAPTKASRRHALCSAVPKRGARIRAARGGLAKTQTAGRISRSEARPNNLLSPTCSHGREPPA